MSSTTGTGPVLPVLLVQVTLVTAIGFNGATSSKLPNLELRFIAQGETTTAEDHELSDETWAIVEGSHTRTYLKSLYPTCSSPCKWEEQDEAILR